MAKTISIGQVAEATGLPARSLDRRATELGFLAAGRGIRRPFSFDDALIFSIVSKMKLIGGPRYKPYLKILFGNLLEDLRGDRQGFKESIVLMAHEEAAHFSVRLFNRSAGQWFKPNLLFTTTMFPISQLWHALEPLFEPPETPEQAKARRKRVAKKRLNKARLDAMTRKAVP